MNDKYYQVDVLNFLRKQHGRELWVQLSGSSDIFGAEVYFWCGLIPYGKMNETLETSEWAHDYEMYLPGFTKYGNGHVEYISHMDKEFEAFLFSRNFYGIKEDYIEVAEEFRFLNNLYYDKSDSNYYSISENGETECVIKTEGDNVFCKLKYLKKYSAAKQSAIVLYFDSRYEFRSRLEEVSISKTFNLVKEELFTYDINIDNHDMVFHDEKKSYSIVHGKKIIIGGEISNSGYWPFEREKNYEDFIIGTDTEGENFYYSSNHKKLSNYFGANPGAPHYLTPVHFSKDVLVKYYAKPEMYEVKDGHIKCKHLWLLRIDNHHDDYVIAYLGDLGRDLPSKEQTYWKSFNVVPQGGLSEAKYKRDFLAQFADPDIIDLKFKQTFKSFKEKWRLKYDWDLFLDFTEQDEYNFEHLRIPVANSQVEFDGQILSLVKTIIDSINEKKLTKLILSNENIKGSISKVEQFLKENSIEDYETHIKFLRNLQSLRSTGSGHRKGKSYEKASNEFSLNENGFVQTFKTILDSSLALLNFLESTLIKGDIRL